MNEKKIFVFTILFTLLIITSTSASAKTLCVKKGECRGGYGSLQEAINAATEGDVILVREGRYNENIFVSKSLSIISENKRPEKTVITA